MNPQNLQALNSFKEMIISNVYHNLLSRKEGADRKFLVLI